MKKRALGLFLALTLVCTLCIGFVGSAAATNLEPTYKIAFICQSMQNESQAFAAKMFEKHASEYGVEGIVMDAKADPATEAQLINTAIAQGVDAIIINPNDPNGIVPALMSAKDAGIVICLYSSDLAPDNQFLRDFYVGANDLLAGQAAAATFIANFPDGANIVEIGGQSGHDAQIKRHNGFIEGLEGSNINLMETQNCSAWSTNDVLNIMQDYIVKYGNEIDGVFCHWDNGATGIIQAVTNAGVALPFIVAVDGNRAGFDQVKAGQQAVSLAQNFETMSMWALELCRKVLEGEDVAEINYIPWETVSAETVDSLTYPEW